MNNDTLNLSGVIEVTNGQGVVDIELDQDAIDELISDLKSLRGRSDHVHYFSEKWGGSDLNVRPTKNGQTPVHHIKITKV